MSPLASLARAYERLADRGEVPPFGYSAERIAFLVVLDEEGRACGRPVDLRQQQGRRFLAPTMNVPQPTKRTSGVAANFLWDKTSYALGVTAGEGRRTAAEHAAFVERHRAALGGTDDAGLSALLRFLERWSPEDFARLGWPAEMKDQNLAFALEEEYRERRIHDRSAARALWGRLSSRDGATEAACLVTGERGPVARLHPAIKGVWGAQSSGASLVSFNQDAFTSYGHEQGDNAPVSEAAAFAYTTVLNHLLDRDSPNRLQVGDASTVFWAEAPEATAEKEAEGLFAALLQADRVDEGSEARKIRSILEKIRAGRPLAEIRPDLPPGVRFYVLGLSPNAARLSVRFWLEDDFGVIAERYLAHLAAMRIEPPPREESPSLWRFLIETAAQRKSDNIPPKLAGDWLRAILTGTPYPLTLMSMLLMRLRADKDVNALRAALLKAVLISRNRTEEVPVSLDPENRDPGYLLGRLFATYEYVQTQALGGSVNATIRDQYYGTASTSPRAIFPILQRKATHHLSRLRKDRPGLFTALDRRIGGIFELAEPEALFVPTLTAQRQALFAIGYYHQRNDFYRGKGSGEAENRAEGETE